MYARQEASDTLRSSSRDHRHSELTCLADARTRGDSHGQRDCSATIANTKAKMAIGFQAGTTALLTERVDATQAASY
jgi:hypothetical protein